MNLVIPAVFMTAIIMAIFSILARDVTGVFDDLRASRTTQRVRAVQQIVTEFNRHANSTSVAAAPTVRLTLINVGNTALAQFADWDVIFEIQGSPGLAIARLGHTTSSSPALNEWTVQGIYLDSTALTQEVADPGVFNPGEEMIVLARPSPSVTANTYDRATFVAPNGVTAKVIFEVTGGPYYLHNDPTPPTDHTNAQASLPLSKTAPTSTTLFNYDKDRDNDTGLLVQKGGSGPGETDPVKHQVWRTGALSQGLNIAGTVTIELWAAVKAFQLQEAGEVTVFLRDYNGSTHTEIGNGTVSDANWQGGSSSWVSKTITISGINHTIPVDNELEIELIVGANADDDMWFAYDTTSYSSFVSVP